MRSVEVHWTVAAPPERVFRIATDLRRLPETMSGIEAVEVLSEGPFGEGTRVTFVFGARPVSLVARLFSIFSGLMTKSVRKALEQDLDDLKRTAESAG